MSFNALLTTAAFARIESQGWLRVTGEDRVRWLNGMTTNSIQDLKPGQGCYTFFLNAQGRIQADATAWMFDDCILLETAFPGSLATLLDHFIIMDDVELEVLAAQTRKGLLIAGPAAAEVLSHTAPLQPLTLTRETEGGRELTLIHAYSPLVPCYEMWSDAAVLENFILKIPQATPADLEQLRILSGMPLYGTDIRNTETHKDLPQETAQTRALHFAKGCYLGQEIVERIRSRGAVHRTFTGFTLQGEQPPTGTMLFADEFPEKPIGELTSVTATPFGLFALGYLRHEALDRGNRIQYLGGTVTPAALPFHLART